MTEVTGLRKSEKRRQFGPFLLILVIYAILSFICFWGIWSANPRIVTSIGGDQFNTIWFLRWIPFSLGHGLNPFFTDYANFPFGVNVLDNTSVPLLGLLASPITLLLGPIASFNVLITAALALSALSGYVFVHHWVPSRFAAFVGGLIYGFSPYQVAQSTGHLNLTFVVFPPLILLALDEVFVRQRHSSRWGGLLLALLVVCQFFVSSEVVASTLIVGLIGLVVAAIIGRRSIKERLHHAAVGIAWGAGASILVLAYPVWFALRGPGHINGRIQLEPQAYRADLFGPILPDHFMRLAPHFSTRLADTFATSSVENGSYLGIALLIGLLLAVIIYWRSPVIKVAAIVGATAFIISLGGNLVISHRPMGPIGLVLPEKLFTKLPLLDNTVPARYALYVALMAALVFSYLLDQLLTSNQSRHSQQRKTTWPLAMIVAIIGLVPLVPVAPFEGMGPVTTPALFTSSQSGSLLDNSVTLVVPYPSSPFPSGQVWQALADLKFKMPGGYYLLPAGSKKQIAYSPVLLYTQNTLMARTLVDLSLGRPPIETPALRSALRAQLVSWKVNNIAGGKDAIVNPTQTVQFLTWLIGRPPQLADGTYLWGSIR